MSISFDEKDISSNYTNCVITDLDGTLLNKNSKISFKNLETLENLKKNNTLRIFATGRSFVSACRVLNDNSPLDYLVFSSGAGIYNWNKKKLVYSVNLSENEVSEIYNFILNNIKCDFSIQSEIPNNHHFDYFITFAENSDMKHRLKLYKETSNKFNLDNNYNCKRASQFILIHPNPITGKEIYEYLENELKDFKIIRATSPLDHKSVWIEIFPKNISKANACSIITNNHKISENKIMAIGNDYNDIDLLNWCKNSFIVQNAPEDIRKNYRIVATNNKNGFSQAVDLFLKEI